MPNFSIIIPAYNRALTLPRSIESVFNQTYSNWELILIDDGSTDKTVDLIEQYQNEKRLRYIKQQNCGVSQARNNGAKLAKGDWLVFLDADDCMEIDCLYSFKENIDRSPNIKFWVGGYKRIFKDFYELSVPEIGKYSAVLAGTFTVEKFFFINIGGYNTQLKFAENSELFHRVSSVYNLDIGNIKKVLLNYFDSKKGGSKNLENATDSILLILKIHELTLSPTVKFLYNQIIGVNSLRFKKFDLAKKHFWKSIYYKPWRIDTWARLMIAFLPLVSKKIYRER
jgi:glycosyltransferase involved in cell wall biosynthesis